MNEDATAALARATDPETSHAAAASIDAASLAGKVLADLHARGPATAHILAARLGLELVTVSPRMRPLEMLDLVERNGKQDGRTVWKAKAAA